MKGMVASHGYKSKAPWADRVQKPKKKKPKRFCLECNKKLVYEHGNSLRCGNEREKTGCAYKAYIKRNKTWKKEVGYNKRPERRIKMLEYGRKYDKKRIRTTN